MTPRPLLPVEIDTIRVALALLRATPADSAALEAARVEADGAAMISDEAIGTLSAALATANIVTLWRRTAP